MGYNDLTAPFEGGNDEWNDQEVIINDLLVGDDTEDPGHPNEERSYNDLTFNVNNVPPGSGDEWNDEM